MTISVRELEERDIEHITDYFLCSGDDFLVGMGVDLTKVPDRETWQKMLREQLSQPYNKKQSYCLVWEVDGKAIGHSNVNKILFGKEAYMHLHLWNNNVRKKGLGTTLVKMTLPYFFKNLHLKTLYCEPYSLNPAPNNTLKKIGFTFVKDYVCTPGWINFEQRVNLWELGLEEFEKMDFKERG